MADRIISLEFSSLLSEEFVFDPGVADVATLRVRIDGCGVVSLTQVQVFGFRQ